MTVYVVMGNDYPSCVFADKDEADAFCKKNMDEQPTLYGSIRIYYRVYPFIVQ